MEDPNETYFIPVKRKRVVLTLEQKLEVIKLKEEGKSFYEIAAKFNIGVSTIKDLLKKRDQINDAVLRHKVMGFTRKTLREGKNPDIEEKLYQWACERLDSNDVITNNMLLAKARDITRDIKQIDWKPSKGWLSKFKQRYCLVKEEYITEDTEIVEQCTDDDDSKMELEEVISEEEKTEVVEEVYTFQEVAEHQITPLEAADRLLEFVVANNFPLKEVITLRMIRDRVIELQDVPKPKDDFGGN